MKGVRGLVGYVENSKRLKRTCLVATRLAVPPARWHPISRMRSISD